MWKSIKAHLYVLCNRKSTWIMWFFMLGIVAINFISNVSTYYGYDVSYMCNPLRLLWLTSNNAIGFLYIQYYPLIVVLPTAFSFLQDKNSREIVFLQTKTSRKIYYISKVCSTFLCTFIIYTTPLLIEMILNFIAFPVDFDISLNQGNNLVLSQAYTEEVNNYFLSEVWIDNKIIYTFIVVILFGVISAVLSCFAQGLSMIFNMKFRIFIFLPVYIMFYAIGILGRSIGKETMMDYYGYIEMFSMCEKSELIYFGFLGMLAVLIGIMTIFCIRRDEVL